MKQNLILKSIKHWEKDIIEPLENGRKGIIDNYGYGCLIWSGNGDPVKCYAEHCPLCAEYKLKCKECPLFQIGERCEDEDSAWSKFQEKPILSNARKMVKALKKCLEEDK